ncbi:MAG: glycoside hydrolase family 31, partial [Propionibacteriaceae bacterium]|nr:glycoside hydrolase family 31 [Propionibacteriaceae bacterium]
MIQHRPLGSGHPYAVDTEQRWPDPPLVGQALHLGVRTSGDIERVMVEVETSAGPSQTELTPVVRSSRGQSQDGGHLASAQAKQARRQGGWQTELTVVEAGPIRYRFTALSADGRQQRTKWYSCRAASWRPAPDSALAVDGSSQRLIPGTVEILDDGQRRHRLRFALALDPMEHVSGFGERYDRLDQRGVALDSQVFEQYKSQGLHRRTYLPMPFAHVVGAQGWGFHVRSSRRVWFDLTQPDRIVIEAIIDPKATPQTQIDRDGRLAGANDPGATRRDSSDPSTATAARFDQSTSSDEAPLTLAVYQGSPDQVLAAFLAEVGRPRELPSWVFRLWASGNEWNTQAEVERQVELHRRHDIPVGNVVVEAWSDESTFTIFRDAQYRVRGDGGPLRLADFSFPPDGAWPDPKAMTDRLHAAGIRLHLWQIPLLKMRPHPSGQLKADAAAALRQDLLIQETAPDGSLRPYRNRGWWFPLALMPDLTDQRAAGWWTDKRRYLVEEIGIDGFKTDGGEHAWGSDLVYLDGRRGDEANNQFPVAYAAAYGRLLESCGKAPVTFSRAGFTGSQAHGAFWAGDENSTWEAFRWSMIAGLNAAACGIVYWGWDIAGF